MTTRTLMDRYAVDVAGAYNCVRLVDTEEFWKLYDRRETHEIVH